MNLDHELKYSPSKVICKLDSGKIYLFCLYYPHYVDLSTVPCIAEVLLVMTSWAHSKNTIWYCISSCIIVHFGLMPTVWCGVKHLKLFLKTPYCWVSTQVLLTFGLVTLQVVYRKFEEALTCVKFSLKFEFLGMKITLKVKLFWKCLFESVSSKFSREILACDKFGRGVQLPARLGGPNKIDMMK